MVRAYPAGERPRRPPRLPRDEPTPGIDSLSDLRQGVMVRVLVIKPSSLGDIIHSAEGVERLSRAAADCRISWVVNEGLEDFVRELPGVAEVIPFPRGSFRLRRFPFWLPRWSRWVKGLRRSFDVAVDLQGLQRSGLFARLSGARERFGPSDARELAALHYTSRIVVPRDVPHAIDRVNQLVEEVCRRSRFLDESGETGRGQAPFRLPVPAEAREEARTLLADETRGLVVLCPGARWETKLWPADRWAALLDLLGERHPELRPVFVGARGEEPLVEAIRERASVRTESFVGKTSVWVTAALMERARGVVTLDSAPLHLAVAAGAPTVSFFGPTDPEKV